MPALSLEPVQRTLTLPSLAALDLRLPRWSATLALVVITLGLATLAARWRDPQLTRLQLQGAFARVQPEAVREAALARLGEGFFRVDIDAVRDQVASLPWVSQARVERAWPTGLRIRVWEREAYARWNAGSLLDTDGAAFTPAAGDLPESLSAGLPRLGGTPGTEQRVGQAYRTLSNALAGTSLTLSGLQIDARGEWTAQTQRGIELRLGQQDPAEKLPVLLDALPTALGDRLSEVAYVDLRYTNGFAIGWIEQPKPGRSQEDKNRPGVATTSVDRAPSVPAQQGGNRGKT